MGCVQSKTQNSYNKKNKISNSSLLQNSQLIQQNKQNIIRQSTRYSSLAEKHRILINEALKSAMKNFQTSDYNDVKQEQKKIISSLNRYYDKTRKKGSVIDESNMLECDYEMILKTIKKHYFFKQLFQFENKDEHFRSLLLCVNKRTLHYKQYVYKQFDVSTKFYIVGQGKLSLELHSVGLKILTQGDFFGLQSIIYDSEQTESVKVRTPKAILYQINREQILKIRQHISCINKDEMKRLFQQKVIFFNFLNNKQKQKLMSQSVKCCYSKGDLIFQKDYESTSFYIIKQGSVLIKVPNKDNIILTNGSFGQSAFYEYKSQRKGTAISYENNTVIYAIGSRPIYQSLGDKLDCAVLHNLQKWAMYRDPYLNDLYLTHKFQMSHLLNTFNIKKGQKFQSLACKNQQAEKVFVNLTCKINYQNDITVINSKAVKYFIDKYFDEKARHMKRERLIKKYQKARDNFFKLNQLEQQWAKLQSKQQKSTQPPKYQNDIVLTAKGTYAQASVQKIVDMIINTIQKPEQIKLIKIRIDLSVRNIKSYIVICEKTERSTYLAIERNFGIQHILKIYHKKHKSKLTSQLKTFNTLQVQSIIPSKQKQDNQLLLQQNVRLASQHAKIISSLIHPHICGFYKAEQDDDNIYLILQYIKGITLFQLQIQLGIVPQVVIKYYLLKISLILDYLHSQKVVYRDLKPDNILIDNKGYPNFYDFKTAKRLKPQQNYKTSTIIGTPHYMAPQVIIQNVDYSFNVDYWQLGIILYQLIYQKYPFGNDQQDPVEIFTAILKQQPKLKKQNSNTILKNLLQKNPELRVSNFQQLIKQSYFQNFQWEQLQNNQMKPPFVPQSISKRFDNLPYYSRNTNEQ